MDNQELQVVQANETSLYLITKAEIDTQISTAKAFPRSLTVFMQKAQSMATITEDIAASCCYALPRGGKSIEGPSIRLAEIVVAAYGNVRAGARVIADDGKMITSQGVCHDLENNVSATVEVMRRVTDKNGKRFSDDMIAVTANAANAIAYRNAVYKVIPAALINPVFEQAKQVARGNAETLVARRNKAMEYFRGIGVKDEQVCTALGIKKIEDIDLDKLQTLTGMRSAIKNGESTVKDLFEAEAAGPALEDLQELFNLKVGSMSPEDVVNAERIIAQKEEASYSKLYKKLQGL